MEDYALAVLFALFLGLATHQYYLSRSNVKKAELPPGPPAEASWLYSWWFKLPKLIPSQHPWRKLKEYTDQYGDLITLRFANGQLLFVCGNATTAEALLVKQSAQSTDRPRLVMAGEIMSGNKRILTMGHTERWRMYRKIMHEALKNTMAKEYENIQEKEALITAKQIGANPSQFLHHFSRYAASTIMTIVYDHPVIALDDPLVQAVNKCLESLSLYIKPGASKLDHYPFLNYLPTIINPWKQKGKQLHIEELDLFLSVYRNVRSRARNNEAQSCFASQLQERQEEFGLTDEEACYIAGSLFGAGSDTTASALSVFVMAMISHPEAQQKAQEEIDRVVGKDRVPNFQDQDSLPYLRALCQEVHRWRPVSSGGFRHALTSDVQYGKYVLPKGSAILGNHWSIHLDPREYKNPDHFDPSRFLSEDGQSVRGTWFSPKGHYQFGFGRRVCVGSNVAERSVFINAALLLWAFNMKAPGGRTQDVDTLAFDSMANSHPLPFEAEFEFRSSQHQKLLGEMYSIHIK